jgi:hypothetical protein
VQAQQDIDMIRLGPSLQLHAEPKSIMVLLLMQSQHTGLWRRRMEQSHLPRTHAVAHPPPMQSGILRNHPMLQAPL